MISLRCPCLLFIGQTSLVIHSRSYNLYFKCYDNQNHGWLTWIRDAQQDKVAVATHWNYTVGTSFWLKNSNRTMLQPVEDHQKAMTAVHQHGVRYLNSEYKRSTMVCKRDTQKDRERKSETERTCVTSDKLFFKFVFNFLWSIISSIHSISL